MPAPRRGIRHVFVLGVVDAEHPLVGRSVHLRIDEVGDPAEGEGERDRDRKLVGEPVEGEAVLAGEPDDHNEHPGQASMKRQTAAPDRDPGERVQTVAAVFEDEDVEEPRPDQRRKDGRENKALRDFGRQVPDFPRPGRAPEREIHEQHPQHVREGIPADSEAFGELDEKRIEVVDDGRHGRLSGVGGRSGFSAGDGGGRRRAPAADAASSTALLPHSAHHHQIRFLTYATGAVGGIGPARSGTVHRGQRGDPPIRIRRRRSARSPRV